MKYGKSRLTLIYCKPIVHDTSFEASTVKTYVYFYALQSKYVCAYSIVFALVVNGVVLSYFSRLNGHFVLRSKSKYIINQFVTFKIDC